MIYRILNKYMLIIFVVIFVLLLQGCREESIKLKGELLIPIAMDVNEKHNIYSVRLGDNENIKEYFKYQNYSELRFPILKDNIFMCVGRNIKENYYVLLKVKENEVTEIMKSNKAIYFPVATDDNAIIFIQKTNGKAYLFKYNIMNQVTEKIYNGTVDLESRPAITSDNSILFVSNDNDNYKIKLMNKDGSIQELVKGGYPLWLEEGKKIMYYTSRSLHLYDIETKKDKKIKNNITLIETPVLSPDKKYMAFYEYDKTVALGGEDTEFLSVMEIGKWKKKHIKAYNKSRQILDGTGVVWLK